MRDRNGFTLIEVMAAMVLFMGGVLMMLELTGNLAAQVERSALITEVASIARAQVDSLEALGYGALSAGSTAATVTLRPNLDWTVTRTVSQYSPLVKQVTVSVDPSGHSGPARSVSLWVADAW